MMLVGVRWCWDSLPIGAVLIDLGNVGGPQANRTRLGAPFGQQRNQFHPARYHAVPGRRSGTSSTLSDNRGPPRSRLLTLLAQTGNPPVRDFVRRRIRLVTSPSSSSAAGSRCWRCEEGRLRRAHNRAGHLGASGAGRGVQTIAYALAHAPRAAV
uniref:(northern house mosquito) hypothetical protein n=1 Tax=Culex pipiens TaxID=7175 RepID=A0A8D8B1G0_CULPI